MPSDTPQTLDPLWATTARFLVALASALAAGVALATMAANASETTSPLLAVAAVLVLGCAIGVELVAASPFRAPFRRPGLVVTVILLAAAVWLQSLSTLGANSHILDDWATAVVALLLFPMACFRPAGEIVAATAILAVAVGTTPLLHGATLITEVPPTVFTLVVSGPVVASGLAAAAFSRTVVADLTSWRGSAQRVVAVDDAQSAALIDQVAAERVELLSREILPLLASVAQARRLTARESDRARMLASSLRNVLVDETERSWADDLGIPVSDPQHAAESFTAAQRAVTRALLDRATAESVTSELMMAIDSQDGVVSVHIRGSFAMGGRPSRNALAPYVATLRIAFDAVRTRITPVSVDLYFELPPASDATAARPRR